MVFKKNINCISADKAGRCNFNVSRVCNGTDELTQGFLMARHEAAVADDEQQQQHPAHAAEQPGHPHDARAALHRPTRCVN